MKHLLLLNLFVCFLFLAGNQSFAQWAVCTPNPQTVDPEGVGVRDPIDLPVAFPGEYYNTVLTIMAPSIATTWGFLDIKITKIQLTEMVNMPGGMTWESNSGNADDYMYGGEKYCMIVEGYPTGAVGIRKIDVYANAWIRVIFETQAPGNPQLGGDVTFTLCNSLNLDLGHNLIMTTDEQVTLDVNQNDDYHTYQWQDYSTEPTYLLKGSDLGVGNHKVKVTVIDTVGTTGIYSDRQPVCFKSDSINVAVTQGNSVVSEKANDLIIFPNPSNGKVNIAVNDFKSNIPLEIRDIKGIVVLNTTLLRKETEIDLSQLPKGIYFISVFEDNKTSKPFKIALY
jgi:hypothetical protein